MTPSDTKSDHAARMRRALEVSGRSQSDLATALEVGPSTISQWLKGTRRPDREALERFASAVGVSAAWLDYGQGEGPTPDMVAARRSYQTALEWVFTPEREDGSRDFGNANIFSFNPDIATFTREVLQNVGDAAMGGHARATFTIRRLRGRDLDDFLAAIGWESFEPHVKASVESGQQVGSALETGLRAVESRELLLMEVSDSGTTGLLGPETGRGKFAALCRNNLDSNKDSTGAGGSYGLGKAVLWRMSSLSTVLFMSNLAEPEPDTGHTMLRFIGRSELVWHDVPGDRAYAGPGWFAVRDRERPARPISLWDNPALAQDLHIRRGDDTGTSIVVVGFRDPSSDVEQTPEQLADQVERSVAQHFWPALVTGALSVSVRVAEGKEVLRTAEVQVASLEAELTDLLTRHRRDEVTDTLLEPGDVVRVPIELEVPARLKAGSEHPAFEHTAHVLVRRADPAEDSESLGRAQFFRGTGMVVMQPDMSRVLVGAQPFHVAVLCGTAAGSSDEDEWAEAFLRAAEPPNHDRWELTDKLGREYARGGGAAISRFLTRARRAVRDVLAPAVENPKDGPRDLAALFKLADPQPPERASRLIVDSAVVDEDGAWKIEGTIRTGTPTKRVVGRPMVVFQGETGAGRKVKWAHLEGDGKACRAEGDLLIIEKGHRTARFQGRTDPTDHPVPTMGAAITIDFRAVREGAAS